ncbi:MAG: 5-formyltetrahydrofolate cyclo-ligase [Candidatus Woesearchaeota archaeon]|nr:MAG: 5-formyltetrahydrofolate cyclo-ligase [Candidatus Woesearchaeota archaeon]
MEKSELRKKILDQRNKLTKEAILDRSLKIKRNLYLLKEFKEAEAFNCYVSKDSEVSTHDILKENKNKKLVCVPCVSEKNIVNSCLKDFDKLVERCFGILEPKTIEEINKSKLDVVIVPGIVFDRKGYRIGYGMGYYDRFLSNLNVMKISLAYNFQVLDKIPHDTHDIKLDYIITENEIIECKMNKIIDGREVADKIYSELKQKISKLPRKPGLGVILVGDNPASLKYISIKEEKCRELGILFKKVHLEEEISKEKLIEEIDKLNNDKTIDGVLIQLPLPKFDTIEILSNIKRDKDVEGLHPDNFSKLVRGEKVLTVTPTAFIHLMEYYNIDPSKRDVVIINDSYLIGKPLMYILLNKKATVDVCNRSTSNLKNHTIKADILISAVGKPNLITSDMVKEGVIIFDAGFSLVNNQVVGDVDFENVKNKCKYITPNPGGVGPVTVALLMQNTYELCKKHLI